jgi:GNAT superfamily N-acetyltransferase
MKEHKTAHQPEWIKGFSLFIGLFLLLGNVLLHFLINGFLSLSAETNFILNVNYFSFTHWIIALTALIFFIRKKRAWKWVWFGILIIDVFAFDSVYFFSVSFLFINMIPLLLLILHLHHNRDIMRTLNLIDEEKSSAKLHETGPLKDKFLDYPDDALKDMVKNGRHTASAQEAAKQLYLSRNTDITIIETTEPDIEQKIQLVKLWNTVYPASISFRHAGALDEYLSGLDKLSHTFMLDSLDQICAWYFDFMRDEKRFFGLLIHTDFQGKGLGKQLLNKAKKQHDQLNGWVVDQQGLLLSNGQEYSSPLSFYLKNGFVKKSGERWDTDKLQCVKVSWHKSDQVS